VIDGVRRPNAAAVTSDDVRLRESTKAMEGLFVAQLFKAMRATVPQQEGFVSGGAGEEIFTSLMDEHLAAETPNQWEGGLAEALYRQLRKTAPVAAAPAPESHPVSNTL
jgi:peptidoglycan hydrolase FlgJ